MNNFLFDMISEGDLTLPMQLAMDGRKITGYAIREARPGRRYPASENSDVPGWAEKPLPKRLVFFWTSGQEDYTPLPFSLDAQGAADFARRWLDTVDYGRQPDHDGDNKKGWRLSCGRSDFVDEHYSVLLTVSPVWAVYGK